MECAKSFAKMAESAKAVASQQVMVFCFDKMWYMMYYHLNFWELFWNKVILLFDTDIKFIKSESKAIYNVFHFK